VGTLRTGSAGACVTSRLSDREKSQATDLNVTFGGNLRADAADERFAIATDQPVSGGGDGSAPAPFDLYPASLAACAGAFMRALMRQRSIDPAGSGITMSTETELQKGMIGRSAFDPRLPESFPVECEQAMARAVDWGTVTRHVQDPPG
jgi:putative redox protein